MQFATSETPKPLSQLLSSEQLAELSRYRYSIVEVALENENSFDLYIKEGTNSGIKDTPPVGAGAIVYVKLANFDLVFIANADGNPTGTMRLVYSFKSNN